MEKAFKELILALRSIGDALMGKITSSNNNNDEGGFLRNYNTVVGVKGIYPVYTYDNLHNTIGIEDIIEETPVFLFDKTKSLSENFKLFCSQNFEFIMNMEDDRNNYRLLPVYENNDNKNIYDFDRFKIEIYDITDEYDYDNGLEFLSSENCELCIECYNMTDSWNPVSREAMGFIPVDNKHYIIFFNDYLTLYSNNNNDNNDNDMGVAKGLRKSSSESEESFKSFINRLKENRERSKKEREEINEDRRKAFLEFLNKLKKAEEKEEEQKETTEEVKEEVKEENVENTIKEDVKEDVKEEVKESEKPSESETKQEETK